METVKQSIAKATAKSICPILVFCPQNYEIIMNYEL